MKDLDHTGAFKRDLKRITRRGYDLTRLAAVLRMLQAETPLPASNRPHALKGRWKGFLECHVAPDWLLINRVEESRIILTRTGTHSDLFNQ